MSRLFAMLGGDIRLQIRNGFYGAAGFVALCWIAGLSFLPRAELTNLLPLFLLSNFLINTFYFMAGLILLEKDEGTLQALVVTPIRISEYLLAKTISLTLLSLAEGLLILVLVYGMQVNIFYVLPGMISAAFIYSLSGFIAVSRFGSINEFLFPSFLYMLLFVPPFLAYFGIAEGWWMYLHPLQAPLYLVWAGFHSLPTWKIIYAILAAIIWTGLLFILAGGAFQKFIIMAKGKHL